MKPTRLPAGVSRTFGNIFAALKQCPKCGGPLRIFACQPEPVCSACIITTQGPIEGRLQLLTWKERDQDRETLQAAVNIAEHNARMRRVIENLKRNFPPLFR
jgi:hypothetical protein